MIVLEERCLRSFAIHGTVFILISGSLLHFLYEWSGRNPFIGALTPVNESVWEHLKLVFLPGVALLVLESIFCKTSNRGSIIAGKTIGIFVMVFSILGGFYLYTLFLSHNLIFDILLMFVAVALGQFASYRVSRSKAVSPFLATIALFLLISLGFAFVAFTFWPPLLEPFRDSITGAYGI